MLISYSNLFVHVKMKLLFYCLWSKNVSTVRWRFWHPELRINTFLLFLVSILQLGMLWRRGSDPRVSQATPLRCRARQVSVHVPSLHKPSIASLARHQANAVEFATKFASRSSMVHWGITVLCTMAATWEPIHTCTKLLISLSTCTRFSSNHFVQILYLFVHPLFLRIYSVIYIL